MILISKENPYAKLKDLAVEEQTKLMQTFTKGIEAVKTQKSENRETVKVFGKLACLAEVRLNAAIAANVFPANKSLASYIEDLTGQKPANHGLTLKNAFGSFVIPGHITENDYDVNSSNCLELAARIVSACKGDLTHEAVQKAIAELKERGDKEAAKLRDILASLKPAVKMTAAEALELISQIRADGHFGMILVQLPDEMFKLSEADQASAYIAFNNAIQNVNKMFGPKVDAWLEADLKATSEVKITRGETTPEAAPEAPSAPTPGAWVYPDDIRARLEDWEIAEDAAQLAEWRAAGKTEAEIATMMEDVYAIIREEKAGVPESVEA